jgi:hypothetical protein
MIRDHILHEAFRPADKLTGTDSLAGHSPASHHGNPVCRAVLLGWAAVGLTPRKHSPPRWSMDRPLGGAVAGREWIQIGKLELDMTAQRNLLFRLFLPQTARFFTS